MNEQPPIDRSEHSAERDASRLDDGELRAGELDAVAHRTGPAHTPPCEQVPPLGSPDADTSSGEAAVRSASDRRLGLATFIIQPVLVLASGVLVIVLLGVAQRCGWIAAGGGAAHGGASVQSGAGATRYICPMMCTPPQNEPGRCPVCAMELVPASGGAGSDDDSPAIAIEPVARRIANIRTAPVESMAVQREVRTIGRLTFNEGAMKTIAAYVDGRLEKMYADYTGVEVHQGDHLALLYSPRLFSSQVEFLLARKAMLETNTSTRLRTRQSSRELYESARERLLELGMTAEQIAALEQRGEASSRLPLCAPISGTVMEKLAVEGQYVKEGQPIYRLADLSTLWLMLELFPEDAARVRIGQQVETTVQSLPGRRFPGRVEFIDPQVDPKTRTVGVRAVLPNREGVLRVGDYARARIKMPAGSASEVLVVPRHAVLIVGDTSVVYVEVEPGRFELRRVVLGDICGDRVVVREGVVRGDRVATRGAFLIDSQMQLAGKPSLIDPNRYESKSVSAEEAQLAAALESLSPDDRKLVERQEICPVTEAPLGSMGTPIKVDVNGEPVFICCEGCRKPLLEESQKYLHVLMARRTADDDSPGTASSASVPRIGPAAPSIPVLVPSSGVAPSMPSPPVPTVGPSPANGPVEVLP